MFDRRGVMISGLALGVAGAAKARQVRHARRDAIRAIALPSGFNGLIACARGGRIEALRCVGLADVATRHPITPATQFKFGSASKWLTSVAVLRLIEQRKLDLDAPIGTYLPTLPATTGQKVQLHHLLSNTSGIPDLLSRQIGREPELRASHASPAAMVARFAGGDLTFAPGAGWDYSALNWVLVAAILEARTGQAFPDVVRRLVFDPLGMTGAGFAQFDAPALPRLASAYGQDHSAKMGLLPPFVAASGTIAGTLDDAVRAAHGIFHGGLLSAPSRLALRTVRWAPEEYALGGRIHRIDGDPWAWETGKVQAYRAHIAHRLERSETIVVFNTNDMEQSDISRWVEAIARA